MSTEELARQEMVLTYVAASNLARIPVDYTLMDSSTHNLLQEMGYKVQYDPTTLTYYVSQPLIDQYRYKEPTIYPENIYVPEGY